MEGQPGTFDWTVNHPPDQTIEAEYGPNAPFWITSLGQTIADYGTTTTEPEPSTLSPLRRTLENVPSNEEFSENLLSICANGTNI